MKKFYLFLLVLLACGFQASTAKSFRSLNSKFLVSSITHDDQNIYIGTKNGLIVIDKDINYNEVKLYNAFCESCDIEKDFNLDDYPEYTLSGPFVNPEDLMNGI